MNPGLKIEYAYEEKELLTQVTQSDEKAFSMLYQRYFGKVYAMSLSYLSDAMQAKDVVQEVFARIWLKRSQLLTVECFEAWIITITRNLLIKELRKQFPPGWTPEEVDYSDPHHKLSYQELEEMLAEAIENLSVRQKQVYQLNRESGFTHKEIATQLGISVDMSREHLSKAMHHIRAYIVERYGLVGSVMWSLALVEGYFYP